MLPRMDSVRLGRQIRALRRRRGWRQLDLALASGRSQAAISRIEQGASRNLSVGTVAAVAESLGATIDIRLQWHGEALDRLLDVRHAAAVDTTVRLLMKSGWEVRTEVTFGIYGERGSVDVLARHPATGGLLVVEVKSVVPDLQSMLASHDRKVRLAPAIARQQEWPPGPAARLLVLVSGRTVRRRLAEHRSTVAIAYPRSSTAMRAWLRKPTREAIGGVLFVPDMRQAIARRQVARAHPRPRA
jgi:transcriptional regulator with XRE-family HTH domain